MGCNLNCTSGQATTSFDESYHFSPLLSTKSPTPNILAPKSVSDLFSDTPGSECLEELARGVVENINPGIGDIDCLDILLNIALRKDASGTKAEQIIFDLFTGKSGHQGHDDEIALRCLRFYRLAVTSVSHTQLFSKLQELSCLSYMAGMAVQANASEKETIFGFFPFGIPQASQEQLLCSEDFWDNSRTVGTDEIAASLKLLEERTRDEPSQFGNDFAINFPINLFMSKTSENMLKTQLQHQEMAYAANAPDHPFKKINIFPVNDKEHWMLFVAYPVFNASQPDRLATVVFSSVRNLTDERKKAFSEAAAMLNAGPVTYIERNLQQHISNGCGVLVVEAVSQILANRHKEPIHVLEQFAMNIEAKSKGDSLAFSVGKRREIQGDYINVTRHNRQSA
jgi:deubiquitinase